MHCYFHLKVRPKKLSRSTLFSLRAKISISSHTPGQVLHLRQGASNELLDALGREGGEQDHLLSVIKRLFVKCHQETIDQAYSDNVKTARKLLVQSNRN